MMKKCAVFFFLLFAGLSAWAVKPAEYGLERLISAYIHTCKAEIGVAVIVDDRDTVTVNGHCLYPLASVMKFPQALAALDCMDRNRIPLDSVVRILPEDLDPDTYSPMRDLYPYGTNLTIAEMLEFSLVESDNNACDKIFDVLVSPQQVMDYLHALGVSRIRISQTEADMHRDIQNTYANEASPLAVASLFNKLVSRKLIGKSYQHFLCSALIRCATGKNQLSQPLEGTGAVIGHKTGTGGINAYGERIACNDAGFVVLPDGRHYSIAVFVKDSRESDVANAAIIAGISSIVYRYLTE